MDIGEAVRDILSRLDKTERREHRLKERLAAYGDAGLTRLPEGWTDETA